MPRSNHCFHFGHNLLEALRYRFRGDIQILPHLGSGFDKFIQTFWPRDYSWINSPCFFVEGVNRKSLPKDTNSKEAQNVGDVKKLAEVPISEFIKARAQGSVGNLCLNILSYMPEYVFRIIGPSRIPPKRSRTLGGHVEA